MPGTKLQKALAASMAIAVLSLGMGAVSASAATYRGAVSDPADGPVAATDVRAMVERIDTMAATWRIDMTFRGAPTRSTQAKVYLGFSIAGLNSCGSNQGGFVELTFRMARMTSTLHDDCLGSTMGPTSVTKQRDGRHLTVEVHDPRLAAVVPEAATQTRISYHTLVQDLVPQFALAVS